MSQLKQEEAGTKRARRFITDTLSFALKYQTILQPFARYIALLICCVLAFGVALTHADNYDKGSSVSLDASWIMGLGATWQQGSLLGRDTYLTYGPFAQLIASIAMLFNA